MRLDAHQHFWEYNPAEHTWMNDSMGVLRKNYLPADLKPLLDANGFDGCIAVQARQNLEETRWLLDLAGRNPFVRGVVGWVDLRADDVDAQLEEFASDKKLVGMRHIVQDEPDDRFLLGDAFMRGIKRLGAHGLVYDVLVYPKQLGAAAEFVRALPEHMMVLDHIAKPLIGEKKLEPWASEIQALAQSDNVSCKLSGMVTETTWREWKAEDFRPYMEVVLEAFGPERLMIGSDWPVCLLSADYGEAMGLVKDFIGTLSSDEQAAILGGTCARVYGICS
ncbi:MAG: amidohydrolase family protein [Acidobacteriota bacterium]|nr:amidohydrolase family protein [Acidobacteriota bacterium]